MKVTPQGESVDIEVHKGYNSFEVDINGSNREYVKSALLRVCDYCALARLCRPNHDEGYGAYIVRPQNEDVLDTNICWYKRVSN